MAQRQVDDENAQLQRQAQEGRFFWRMGAKTARQQALKKLTLDNRARISILGETTGDPFHISRLADKETLLWKDG